MTTPTPETPMSVEKLIEELVKQHAVRCAGTTVHKNPCPCIGCEATHEIADLAPLILSALRALVAERRRGELAEKVIEAARAVAANYNTAVNDPNNFCDELILGDFNGVASIDAALTAYDAAKEGA